MGEINLHNNGWLQSTQWIRSGTSSVFIYLLAHKTSKREGQENFHRTKTLVKTYKRILKRLKRRTCETLKIKKTRAYSTLDSLPPKKTPCYDYLDRKGYSSSTKETTATDKNKTDSQWQKRESLLDLKEIVLSQLFLNNYLKNPRQTASWSSILDRQSKSFSIELFNWPTTTYHSQ